MAQGVHPGECRQSRRFLLGQAGRWGLGAAALAWTGGVSSGCTGRASVRLGIVAGSQPLWRYVAQRRAEVLEPLGYQATFVNYPTEAALREAFVADKVDVIATLPPLVPSLGEAGADVQFFLPIAWIKEGYPLVAPSASATRSLPDLAGKVVACFPLSHPGLAYWRAFVLQNYGFRLEEKFRLLERDQPHAELFSGEAEAAFVDSMAWSVMKPLGGHRLISDLNTEWQKVSTPPHLLMYGGYLARRNWIAKHKQFVDDFIRVNEAALGLYKTNPSSVLKSAAAYAEGNAPALDEETNRFIGSYLGYDEVPVERMRISKLDVEDYEKVYSLLARAGYLKAEPPSVAGLFYTRG